MVSLLINFLQVRIRQKKNLVNSFTQEKARQLSQGLNLRPLDNLLKTLLLLITRPFSRDGGMAEDHGVPGPGPEVVERQRVAKD